MNEFMLEFWQKWYNEHKQSWEPEGKVTSVDFDVSTEHYGGYGECEYSASADLDFTILPNEEGARSRYVTNEMDGEDLFELFEQAIRFVPSDLG